MLWTADSWTSGATVNPYLYKTRYCAVHHTTLLLSLQAKAVRKGRWDGDWPENSMSSKVLDGSLSCHDNIVFQLELTLAAFMVV